MAEQQDRMNPGLQPTLNCHSSPGLHNLHYSMRIRKTEIKVLAYSFCPTMDCLEQNCTLENPASDEQLAKNKSPERSSKRGI